uniref:Uncharacterized protein n=1 Tax=Strongyloides stercoralis TaxID=6248 RepID=A0AAF5I340_STRER
VIAVNHLSFVDNVIMSTSTKDALKRIKKLFIKVGKRARLKTKHIEYGVVSSIQKKIVVINNVVQLVTIYKYLLSIMPEIGEKLTQKICARLCLTKSYRRRLVFSSHYIEKCVNNALSRFIQNNKVINLRYFYFTKAKSGKQAIITYGLNIIINPINKILKTSHSKKCHSSISLYNICQKNEQNYEFVDNNTKILHVNNKDCNRSIQFVHNRPDVIVVNCKLKEILVIEIVVSNAYLLDVKRKIKRVKYTIKITKKLDDDNYRFVIKDISILRHLGGQYDHNIK